MGVASIPDTPGGNPTKFFSVVSVSNGFSMDTLKELKKIFESKWQTQCPENVIPPKVSKHGIILMLQFSSIMFNTPLILIS